MSGLFPIQEAWRMSSFVLLMVNRMSITARQTISANAADLLLPAGTKGLMPDA
jgi:hypothetical protein